jgi:CheY-like chemotaxis protein
MPITGFSEILIAEPETDEATRLHYLEMINTSARDAGSVVSRLREFYRPNESTDIFGPVLLNRIVKQAANLTQPKWKDQAQANGAQVNVRVHLEDRLPVNGDESALRELLTNLIFNAVDAMPSGGSIQLRTRTDADCGVIEVADTGTGMTEEVRQHCLDPFFSTKGERGTGLGLAMVFGIVQRHQGSIDIVSKVGEGTTFIIRLPLYDEAVALGAGVSSVVSNRSLSVLVVDDEPQVRQVLTAFLHAEGHACETAVHALDGINRFRERHFDIVIADKAMPGMSGDQMAVLLKKLTPSIPVVLLTGFGAFLNGEAMPCVDVIASKPITRAGLRDAMGRALKTA